MVPRIVCLALLVLVGCRKDVRDDAPKSAPPQADDPTPAALDTLRRGDDRAGLRDALFRLNSRFEPPDVAARLVLSRDERQLLEKSAGATPNEISQLELPRFQPLDAIHVENAALFRDAARLFDVPGSATLDRAAFAFDWTARHVLFFEQRFNGLPPAYVLRAGHGNAADRGLVFLALAEQLGLDGCLLAAPNANDASLAGVLIDGSLRLFDLRLGRPVLGPDGDGIASWKDVAKKPELLKDSKISADGIATMEARLAAPFEALSPRMKLLDSLLNGEEEGERLSVYRDFSQIAVAVRAAGLDRVGVWRPALGRNREFASVEDGGGDRTNRAKRFGAALIPWPPVLQRYQELQILGELPTPARETMLNLTADLFDRFYRQPGEMLIRGKVDALPRRLDRVRSVVDDASYDAAAERDLAKLAAAWRSRVNEAYLAAVRREPDAAVKIRTLWEEDQYLLYLIQQPDLEELPRGLAKKAVSRLVLSASRASLAARSNWLFAQLAQDKAERLDYAALAQRQAGRESKSAAALRAAWLNARGAWSQYLERNNLGPAPFASNAPEIRGCIDRGEIERALSLWEYLQREFHHYAAAKLGQARALRRLGQDPNGLLENLGRDIDSLMTDPEIAALRTALAKATSATPDGSRRWALSSRDWGPDGSLSWLAATVERERRLP